MRSTTLLMMLLALALPATAQDAAGAGGKPRVWMRVTLGPEHKDPVYIHCFADHFRAPWYQHFAFSKAGAEETVAPTQGKSVYLAGGERTPWCDITPAVWEDSGAILNLRAAAVYSYTEWYPHFDAVIEFATRPDDAAVVRRIERHGPGAGIGILMPGVLTEKNGSDILPDSEFAAVAKARLAALKLPAFGKRPRRFPFYVHPQLNPHFHSPQVIGAELGLLAAIGFNGLQTELAPVARRKGFPFLGGGGQAWQMKDGIYAQPEVEKIERQIRDNVAKSPAQPAYLMLMDEPTGPPLADVVAKEPYRAAFREWLRSHGQTPASLGVPDRDAVVPVPFAEAARHPELYYFSQRYRTVAMAAYLKIETEMNGRLWPKPPLTTANLSDGATYAGNFYMQGVNYFDVFEPGALSLAWSEDWTNLGSTYQMCGYNVELLRAAVRKRGQPLAMYLITSYGRTPLDVKLKAYSSIARDVRMLTSFAYGPRYAGHEPCWSDRPELFGPLAELSREIGGAEDLLMQARRPASEVAMVYSVSSDIWTAETTNTYGMERQHQYLALAHAQVPVDFLSEEHVAGGALKGRRVAYVVGPNLSRAAARKLREWVVQGGTVVLAAGSALRDEFSRPLQPALVPAADRGKVDEFEPFRGSGGYLNGLRPRGEVRWGAQRMDVLSVQESPGARGAEEFATFADGSPAATVRRVGKGRVYHFGFLPGLSYIRKALVARGASQAPAPAAEDGGSAAPQKMTDLSYNPWEYPAGERRLLLKPVLDAGAARSVRVSVPVVEAYLLEGEAGAVLPLANYALRPIPSLRVSLRLSRPVARIESVRHGRLSHTGKGGRVSFRLPLRDTDFVKVYWRSAPARR